MQLNTESAAVYCPYCGERFEIIVDLSESHQEYIEDCYVCCRPIHLNVSVDSDGDAVVLARDENEC